ncbi:MAG: hypothetical protein SFX18_04700 [Pirellulales bacterium]|nr:hypothetical protein [Pirellulales bacterium]
MKIAFTVFLLQWLVLGTVTGLADQVIEKPEFRLILPEGWRELTRIQLEHINKNAQRVLPKGIQQSYQYGFEQADNKAVNIPNLLVQVKPSGRASDAQIKGLVNLNPNDRVQKFNAIENYTVESYSYDEEHGMLWMKVNVDVANVGKISGLTAMIPTEEGFLQLNAYCPEADAESLTPLFKKIITSVELAPHLVRKPDMNAWNRIFDVSQIARDAAIGGFVGVIVGLVMYLLRKRIKRTAGANSPASNAPGGPPNQPARSSPPSGTE